MLVLPPNQWKVRCPKMGYQFICPKCDYESDIYANNAFNTIEEIIKKAAGYKKKCPVCGAELKKKKRLVIF